MVLAERASEIVRLREELAGKEFLIAEAKGRQELAETRLEERSGEFEDRVKVLEAMVQRLGCIVDTTQVGGGWVGTSLPAAAHSLHTHQMAMQSPHHSTLRGNVSTEGLCSNGHQLGFGRVR